MTSTAFNNENSEGITPQEGRWVILTGYIFLVVSFASFVLWEWLSNSSRHDDFSIFWLHYGLVIVYTIILIASNDIGAYRSWSESRIHYTVIFLNLFLVSAYSLNRSIPVFSESVEWFSGCLILTTLTGMSFRYFDQMPPWINCLQSLFIGFSILLYFYLSVFVGWAYLPAFPGLLCIGIGFHSFVPFLLTFACYTLVRRNWNHLHFSKLLFFSGILIPLAFAGYFSYQWVDRIKTLERITNQSVLTSDAETPAWLAVAQELKMDWISSRLLKSESVYSVASSGGTSVFWGGQSMWREAPRHDPLVVIASLFSQTALSTQDRIRIFELNNKTRSLENNRLRSDRDLTTSYIVSDVDIYPDFRIAYTEKYITIRNNNKNEYWPAPEEAIYTFQLPEGSVVTSLSLWIDGIEEKARLTSKGKAEKAYNTIVGVERRDPSVVHWQEGNTVSVRVFPCTNKSERKFKIGITSPLPDIDHRIVYKNTVFDGPDPSNATETTRIHFIGTPSNPVTPSYLTKDIKSNYVGEHNYDPELTVSFDSAPVPKNLFSFNGFAYSMAVSTPTYQSLKVRDLFLDINSSWSSAEIDRMEEMISSYRVFIWFEGELVKATPDNWPVIKEKLGDRNFSAFPFHLVRHPESSLIVTKGDQASVRLSDFPGSKFALSVSAFFAKGSKVNIFSLSPLSSTYINTFRELRGVNYATGDLNELLEYLNVKRFPVLHEDSTSVDLHDAGLVIHRTVSTPDDEPVNAPDHLARLFAYNSVMSQIGSDYFRKDYEDSVVIAKAAEANIVTPVSSLIVLETQKDYDRFDIKESKNSLNNASHNSDGAVPEPHEWALLIVLAAFLIYLRYRQ